MLVCCLSFWNTDWNLEHVKVRIKYQILSSPLYGMINDENSFKFDLVEIRLIFFFFLSSPVFDSVRARGKNKRAT